MLRSERGQGLAEYALILALVVVVAVVTLALLGDQVALIFSNIADALSGPFTPP